MEWEGYIQVSALLSGESGGGVCILVLITCWSLVCLRLQQNNTQILRGSSWAVVSVQSQCCPLRRGHGAVSGGAGAGQASGDYGSARFLPLS